MIDAIAFEFQTGNQWLLLPEKYGNWRGDYDRLRMWALDGAGAPGRRVSATPRCTNPLTGGTDDTCGATRNFCYLMPGMPV
ncbi:hypothetical protein RKD29_000037 [Streptomyces tendae]